MPDYVSSFLATVPDKSGIILVLSLVAFLGVVALGNCVLAAIHKPRPRANIRSEQPRPNIRR